jgi:DNA sulfur modification protein DndC
MSAIDTSGESTDLDGLLLKLKAIRRELRDEYLKPHSKPWIIGFSGGKDSTLLAHFVIECVLSVPPDERHRTVHIVNNNTLVESPIFQGFVDRLLEQMAESVNALQIPVSVVRTSPKVEETFWVNLLGKGYPAPNRTFRWCTDRMKIRPTTRFIREQVAENGEVILLLGVRSSESQTRASNMAKYAAKSVDNRLSPHADLTGCYVFSPIRDLTTREVWIMLLQSRPPWGGTYHDVVTLYKNALGGECPFVVANDDAPSCGSSSARFGCWTCTVVEKDNSLESLIRAGHDHLAPLADYRNRLKSVSADPEFRSKIRRNGQPGLGPLTLEARKMLLDELLSVQKEIGNELISDYEIRLVKEQWTKDENAGLLRELGAITTN